MLSILGPSSSSALRASSRSARRSCIVSTLHEIDVINTRTQVFLHFSLVTLVKFVLRFGSRLILVGLFGTALALAPAPSLMELELSQTVSTPSKIGVKLGGALSQNELERCGAGFRQLHNSTPDPTPGAKFRSWSSTKQALDGGRKGRLRLSLVFCLLMKSTC